MSKANCEQLKPEAYTRLRGCSPSLCRFLIQQLQVSAKDRVLDLGCGPGENTALISALAGASVEGLDLDPQRIAFARESNPALIFHEANAEMLPFADGSFTNVTMMLSIQRFRERVKVFQEVSRVLAHGGRVGIVTISPEQLAARPDFSAFPSALRMEYERFPAIAALIEELRACGLKRIKDQSFSEVIRPIDATFVRWLEEYPFNVLKRISTDEFRDGLHVIRKSIQSATRVQLLSDECTVITAKKS